MEKKLIKVKEIYEYTGKCPKCGIEEKGDKENDVDVLCYNCAYLQMKKKVKDKYKQLIGSTVIDIDNNGKDLNLIIIKTINGIEYDIQSSGNGIDLHVHEIIK